MSSCKLKKMGALKFSTILVLLGAGCASPSLKKANLEVPRGRSIASLSAKLGLECIAEARVFSADSAGEELSFEHWVEKDLDRNILTREAKAQLIALSAPERRGVLALALAETYTYGQSLSADYDRLIGLGFTLQRIMSDSDTYAKLQALYFTKYELLDLVKREFKEHLISAMAPLANSVGANPIEGFDAMKLVVREVRSFIEPIRAVIVSRAKDSRYATLALAELEVDLGQVMNYSQKCPSPVFVSIQRPFGFSDTAHTAEVIAAVKSLPKDPAAFRFFQPLPGMPGLNIESIVKKRAKDLKPPLRNTGVSRKPQSAPDGKVIYPDEDPSAKGPGNIYGSNFPQGTWALTFDDGPRSPLTPKVLENLSQHGVKATFFVLSQQISSDDCKDIGTRIRKDRPKTVYPEFARRELGEGHAVESHSYYHSQSSKATPEELHCEVVTAMEKLAHVVGIRPKFFRLPYGEGVGIRRIRKVIADAGLVHVHWSVDTLDWNDKDPDSIFQRTINQMKSGRGIILFHDIHPQSVIASEKVMAYLKNPDNKLRVMTIPDIVDEMNGVGSQAR